MDDTRALVHQVFRSIEADNVEAAVSACVRLARALNDYLNWAIFFRELGTDVDHLKQSFVHATKHLPEERRRRIWEKSGEAWIQARTMRFSLTDDPKKNVLALGLGEMEADREQSERSISDLQVPPGMGPYDVAAFTDAQTQLKGQLRLRLRAIATVRHRAKARCLTYATEVEAQLRAQDKSKAFLAGVQTEVDNYFKLNCAPVFEKLQRASELMDGTDAESQALLLTLVRRAVKAVADYFYPAVATSVLCADGIERAMGDEQYLNRLQEYLARRRSSAANDLLQAELAVFVRRLNKMASKGVHADVLATEAKQGLIGLYMFLHTLIAQSPAPINPLRHWRLSQSIASSSLSM